MRCALLLAAGSSTADAESWFTRALTTADELEAPMLQLRSALALAQLWAARGQVDDARAVLGTAYDRISEGFTTADLTDARQLLESLH